MPVWPAGKCDGLTTKLAWGCVWGCTLLPHVQGLTTQVLQTEVVPESNGRQQKVGCLPAQGAAQSPSEGCYKCRRGGSRHLLRDWQRRNHGCGEGMEMPRYTRWGEVRVRRTDARAAAGPDEPGSHVRSLLLEVCPRTGMRTPGAGLGLPRASP
eukprot:CAMPEP_0114290824 /NCGR_PEP_ID=MMETSP0059-20121206/8156_1 /TAXON_ID=36894 /ORGANISM="Pyramimonas parkeae, Strain CCMP726" /LENGTH=153 /DNA_ID=CAMNT_0001412275 /DNA_START=904 /DNA_END=1362 /DNA_ORIENTATION=+